MNACSCNAAIQAQRAENENPVPKSNYTSDHLRFRYAIFFKD